MVPHNMFTGSRPDDYALLVRQASELWEKDLPLAANLANMSALLKQCLDRTNWVGFYLWDETSSQLVLGPFQGLPACTRIGFGKGVCGTAVSTRKTQLVPDVHEFPGHIACDSASNSELVVPLVRGSGRGSDSGSDVLGVLDIDSPDFARFDATDQEWLERFASGIIESWPD